MRIAVPREITAGERRVATTPDVVRQLLKLGFTVSVESGAGLEAQFSDTAYQDAGADIIADTRALWASADIVLRSGRRPPSGTQGRQASLLSPGKTLISFVAGPERALMQVLAATGANVLAMDSVPRRPARRKMDALSSMANIAGYRAIIEANQFGRFFTSRITAAGRSLRPRS